MQVANVKPVLKSDIVSKIQEPALSQNSDVTKELLLVDIQKKPNYSRMFEALNDCV